MPLRLEKRPDSNNWFLRGEVRGVPVRESTGTHRKEAAEAIRIKRESALLAESIHGKQATVTFAEAALSYLDGGGSPTYLGKTQDNGKWTGLLGHFYSTKLASIGQNELDAAARKLLPKVSPETLNRQVYTPFIAVWNHAVANKWADLRKWRRPRKPKGATVEKRRERAGTASITYEQAATFVAAMSPAPAMIMTALFYTGMRPAEAMLLTAEDVNVDERWIVVRKSKTDPDGRGVPMHEFLVPLFTALEPRGGVLFRTHHGEPYVVEYGRAGQFKSAMRGAARRSGVEGVAPYTARHSASVQLVRAGVHPHIKDQILGHAVGQNMSRVYATMPQPDLIEAINKLPVPAAWRRLWWLDDPLAHVSEVVNLSHPKRREARKSA